MNINLRNLSVGKSWTLFTSLCVATGVIANAGVVKALEINLNAPSGIDSDALAGFQEAADIWENQLSDPITVNLNVDFRSLNPGVLGQNRSETLGYTYTEVANALIADSTSGDDATATTNLPGFGSVNVSSSTSEIFTFVGTEEDNTLETIDGSNDSGGVTPTLDNIFLDVTQANAKALGLFDFSDPNADLDKDASITFSSDFNFDLDRSDGISSGQFDFVGVALHEMGHALGFSSGVDIVDFTVGDAANPGNDLDSFRVFTPLDMYRHSDLSVAVSEDAGFPVLDLSVSGKGSAETIEYAGTEYDAEPYLSIDGGTSELFTDGVEGLFSTGRYLGDGQQASHWKDDLGIGLLDPTIAPGVQGDLTSSDIRAFDVIGYDTTASVPFEFSPGWGIFLVGGAYTFKRLKKYRSSL